ncbi:CPBP family glutamic-type intramembrane protease [Capnocytophaga sp.]|uniref:CPBP family glutamic-type intramembrane protease n=1 Tax=Capnocytophaga sp. TaxID=44737 RepID=UPI0026DD3048|nr:CPBP family glutamic-type intramembrane protease [Capnocytophaga sp.]MDO5104353.1 CPBP family glutamic-type intramembrane protease [Capnocytophaga sp.]
MTGRRKVSNKLIFKIFAINIFVVIVFSILEKSLLNICLEAGQNELASMGMVELFFLAVLLAPPLEEFIFRFPLVRRGIWPIALLFGIVFVNISVPNNALLMSAILTGSLFILIEYLFEKQQQVNILTAVLYVFIFTFIHIGNYQEEVFKDKTFVHICLLFFPQFCLGSILTWLRLKKVNFSKIILYHSAYNLIFFILILLSKL